MKNILPTLIALACAQPLLAAESPVAAKTHAGRLATVTLLATGRVTQGAPGGLRFLFLVAPTAGTTGTFTLKETRDFKLGDESYQTLTKARLGQQFEPQTAFDSAEGFFRKQPSARRLAPADIDGAYILTISMPGAPVPEHAPGEISVHVGFDKQVEPFTFVFNAPPEPRKR
jgi:hypothetical protein